MDRLRASIAERRDADALNSEWDSYVRSVGRPTTGTSATLSRLHRLDDAPLPDSVFLSRTWQQVRDLVPTSDASPRTLRRSNVIAHRFRRYTFGRNRRSPSIRVTFATLGLAALLLTLFMGRAVPAGDTTPLVAPALASAAPAVGSPAQRIATRQPTTIAAALNPSAASARPVRAATGPSAHMATHGTPSR